VTFRKVLVFAGLLIAVACLVALGVRAQSIATDLGSLLLQNEVLAGALILSACYGATLLLLALAWVMQIEACWSKARSLRWPLVQAYGASSIAKYLPSNVFHVVGRQILGKRLGISHRYLLLASMGELVFSGAAAAGLASLGLAFRAMAAFVRQEAEEPTRM